MAAPEPDSQGELDDAVRGLLGSGDASGAATLALRRLGPELLGFLSGVMASDSDADDVFSAVSARLWRSLATFEWRCSLRTWTYVIARREVARFREGARRHAAGRIGDSRLDDVVAVVRTETRSALRTENRSKLDELRNELPPDDRELLVLRVDRNLAWDDIALAFVEDPESCGEDARKREAARLRKRFQIVKKRLAERARELGLLPQ